MFKPWRKLGESSNSGQTLKTFAIITKFRQILSHCYQRTLNNRSFICARRLKVIIDGEIDAASVTGSGRGRPNLQRMQN